MRILVTGASGFIGFYLLPRLLTEGHNVIAFDLKFHISKDYKHGQVQFITGDLSSGEGLDQISWECVDVVVHLASAGVKASKRDWHDCIFVNIIGTNQLLNHMSKLDKPPLLIYPRTFYEDYLSEIPSLEKNPYVVTKNATTKIVESWSKHNKNARVVIGTIFQAYGPMDDSENILNYTKNCLRKGVLAELGSCRGMRDWIYIYDLVDAFVKSLSLFGSRIQYYDFGTGKLTSIKEVVETLAKLIDRPLNLLNYDHNRDRGDIKLKAKAETFVPGWKYNYDVNSGLKSFVEKIGT
jgi:UDP-glucose 4-epimerase